MDPEVRAGWLPPGAVAVSLRDRKGVWHEAQIGPGVWLCVLPQRAGQHDPPSRTAPPTATSFGAISTSTNCPRSGRDKPAAHPRWSITAQGSCNSAPLAGTCSSTRATTSHTRRSFRCRAACWAARTVSGSDARTGAGMPGQRADLPACTCTWTGEGEPPERLDLEARRPA